MHTLLAWLSDLASDRLTGGLNWQIRDLFIIQKAVLQGSLVCQLLKLSENHHGLEVLETSFFAKYIKRHNVEIVVLT